MVHDLYLTGKGVDVELYNIGRWRIGGGSGAAALYWRVGCAITLDKIVAGRCHALFQVLGGTLAVTDCQSVNSQIAHSESGDVKLGTCPLPTTKCVHCHTGDQPHLMGLAGELLKGDGLHAPAPQALGPDAHIRVLHIKAGDRPAGGALAPDCLGGWP